MRNFNRNVVTAADLANVHAGSTPKSFDTRPPTGATPGQPATLGPGGVPIPSADDYLTILLKYIPFEILGAYLFIQGVVTSNVQGGHNLAIWLGCLLGGFVLVTLLYDWRVLMIVRVTQYIMSALGLAVYVFALGGWFGTTSWYHSWYAAIALPAFALLVSVIPVPALPLIPPTVDKVTPASGPTAGDTEVTVSGRALYGATAVSFNGTAAATFIPKDDYTITATSPPGHQGSVDIVVTTPAGTSAISTSDQFTYN